MNKKQAAEVFYRELTARNFSRQQIIDFFKENLVMSAAGAATYYYNAKQACDADTANKREADHVRRQREEQRARQEREEALRRAAQEAFERMRQQSQQQTAKPVIKETWFQILGVTNQASKAEINANWRRLVKVHHTDIGGTHDRIASINAARDEGLKRAVK